ncbi:hypothetical protein AUP68_06457 [Ilyonectria robusta]
MPTDQTSDCEEVNLIIVTPIGPAEPAVRRSIFPNFNPLPQQPRPTPTAALVYPQMDPPLFQTHASIVEWLQDVHSTQFWSSPIKLYPFLPLDPDGLEIMPMDLDDADMPDSLGRLVEDIEAIGAGQQVVHASLKSAITQLKATSRSFSSFRDSVYTTDHDNPLSPPSPERFLQDILKIVADAHNCQVLEQDEMGWNHLVHTPLLDAILNRQLETSNLVSFTPWYALQPHHRHCLLLS